MVSYRHTNTNQVAVNLYLRETNNTNLEFGAWSNQVIVASLGRFLASQELLLLTSGLDFLLGDLKTNNSNPKISPVVSIKTVSVHVLENVT